VKEGGERVEGRRSRSGTRNEREGDESVAAEK